MPNQSTTQPGGKPKPTLNSIYDSFGGQHNFLRSYGLKPYDADDVEEGKNIAQTMLEHDLEDWEDCRKAEAVKAANTTVKSTSQNSGKPKRSLKSIYDSFGGRDNFLLSYGLKPYSADDVEEGYRIAQAMLENDSRV